MKVKGENSRIERHKIKYTVERKMCKETDA